MTTIGIFGTGGFAREAGDIVDALGWRTLYIARDADERAAWTGEADIALESEIERFPDVVCVIGIGAGALRERVAQKFDGMLRFTNLLHPDASFGKGTRAAVEARRGVIACPGARFSNSIAIGDFVIINPNATIGHDARLAAFVTVCPGANVSGYVDVGTRAWIGAGAVINQGSAARRLTIGADATIGSGAVVVTDCAEGGTYAGVPARRLR